MKIEKLKNHRRDRGRSRFSIFNFQFSVGVVVITVAGILGAIQVGLPILGTGWILWSLMAFSLSGIAFAVRVAPLQKEIRVLASNADDTSFDWALYRSKSLRWELWGLFATVTPLIAVVLMVIKRPA